MDGKANIANRPGESKPGEAEIAAKKMRARWMATARAG
jgi:hypothetical protein